MSNRSPKPALKTFVPASSVTQPRRSPATNEAILERATAKLAALSDHFDRLVRESPTKEDVHAVYTEARQTRRLLEEHLAHDRADRVVTNQRLEGIMALLGEVLARLPASSMSIPPAPDTPSPETLPERM